MLCMAKFFGIYHHWIVTKHKANGDLFYDYRKMEKMFLFLSIFHRFSALIRKWRNRVTIKQFFLLLGPRSGISMDHVLSGFYSQLLS